MCAATQNSERFELDTIQVLSSERQDQLTDNLIFNIYKETEIIHTLNINTYLKRKFKCRITRPSPQSSAIIDPALTVVLNVPQKRHWSLPMFSLYLPFGHSSQVWVFTFLYLPALQTVRKDVKVFHHPAERAINVDGYVNSFMIVVHENSLFGQIFVSKMISWRTTMKLFCMSIRRDRASCRVVVCYQISMASDEFRVCSIIMCCTSWKTTFAAQENCYSTATGVCANCDAN